MRELTKTLDITMIVSRGGQRVEMYEPESGDYFPINIEPGDDMDEIAKKIGREVLDWMSLMQDELDENTDDAED